MMVNFCKSFFKSTSDQKNQGQCCKMAYRLKAWDWRGCLNCASAWWGA